MKNSYVHYLCMITKFSLCGFLVQCFVFTALMGREGNAQIKSIKEVNIDIHLSGTDIREALQAIEDKTSFHFVFSDGIFRKDMKVSVKAGKKTVADVLNEISRQTGLEFKQLNKNISVKLSPPPPPRQQATPSSMKAITGRVTSSDDGQGLPGVNIVIKGTTKGTVTDVDGNYNLEVDEGAVLVFSSIGYLTQEIIVDTRTTIDVSMAVDVVSLQEVVVVDVGYATMKKSDLTGSVASLSGSDLQKIPIASLGEAMTGRMAGVQITTTEGSPDADIKIRVRGGGSITQDNSPLYIVDGFPVSNISNIPPTDIQSIDVLKDASSTAIYGARGANGVIIITTKGGKEGKISVNFDAYTGVRVMANPIKVLNPYQYVMYQYEIDQTETFKNYYGAYEDLEIYKSVKGRNWVDEVFGRTGTAQNYNLSMNGGNKAVKYGLSFTRTDEKSIMLASGFQRNNVNLKLNSALSDKVTIDFNNRLNYTIIDGAGVSSGSGANTRLRNSVKYAPTLGLRELDPNAANEDDTNSPETASLLYDPVVSTYDEYKKQYQFSNNTNVAFNMQLLKSLRFRTEWSYQFSKDRTDYVWGPSTATSKNNGGQPIGQIVYSEGSGWRTTNTLTYEKNNIFPEHNMTFLLGEELISNSSKSITSESRFFPATMKIKEVLSFMNLGTPQNTITRIAPDVRLSSFFGRLNYTIKDRYLFTFTYRADGSSKFAPGNQWGYFPSAAAAWKINEEDFMKGISWLNTLKLRLSYGSAGNNRIGDGLWRGTFTTSNDNNPYWPSEREASQLIPSSILDNPNLKWETTYTQNLGVDFEIWDARLSGTVDLYYNITKDLLIASPLPSASGRTQQYQNIGQTSNKGVELTLNGILVEKNDFSVSANFNISFNRNNVDKFSNGDADFKTYSSSWNGSSQPLDDYLVQQGRPVGLMYGYVTDGMYSFDDFTYNTTKQVWEINEGVPNSQPLTSSLIGPGMLKFKDVTGEGNITAEDKRVIGNAMPKHTGGLGLNARYRNFDLSVFLNWSYGNDIYNANKLDYTSMLLSRRYQNLTDNMALGKRFTIIDPETGYNIYNGANANPERLQELNKNAKIWSPLMTLTPLHSWAIEDGSFLRVNNVSIGYTLPSEITERLKITRLRVYVTGYNLHTFTRYSGFDPEVDTRRSTPLTPGVDYSAYPKSRSFIGGINLTF